VKRQPVLFVRERVGGEEELGSLRFLSMLNVFISVAGKNGDKV
jgi:hypothetical protein